MKRVLTVVVALMGAASPALADFCMLTHNGERLGHGRAKDPGYKDSKRQALKSMFEVYDVVALQEVMVPDEPALVAPPGYTATVSAPKGERSYVEYYALLTRDTAVTVLDKAEYPDDGKLFSRPPFGVAVEDKDRGRFWLVNIHVVFGKAGPAARRKEVAAMEQVTRFYAGRTLPDGSSIERVLVSGDWNLPTTDEAFEALSRAVPGILAAPNVKSSLNAKGAFVSPYDHFLWNRAHMNVELAPDPRESGGLDTLTYRRKVSDHVGVAGFVMSSPVRSRPDGVSCPPPRLGPTS